jgi:hypothetical protein
MRFRLFLIAIAVLPGAAAIGWLTWPKARAPAAPVATNPVPDTAPHLRRLVATRLHQPRDLRFEGVRLVETQKFGALTCGRVAWSEVDGGARDFKRFVATRRNLILEGQANFEAAWAPCARTME